MASYNKVILLGNVTRDPQVKYTTSGSAVCELGMACSRKFNEKDETLFTDVVLFGRAAEVAGEYLAKGKQVMIEGRLQLDQWTDKTSGEKRSRMKVVCEHLTLLGGGGSGGGQPHILAHVNRQD